MKTRTWQGQALSTAMVDDQYPRPGIWKDDVYYRRQRKREVKISPIFVFNTLSEQCPPLNDDNSTIGTFTYYQGTHIVVKTAACNYHVTLQLQSLATTEQTLSIVINSIETAAVTLSATTKEQKITFDVALTKRQFDLTFTNPEAPVTGGTVQLISLTLTKFAPVAAKKPRLFIASDSTVQTYTQKEYPQTGWGAVLYRYLFPNGTAIITTDSSASYSTATVYRQNDLFIFNKSIGGRSARSFAEEGKLASLAQQLRPNDYLFIQWGDNDATSYRPMRYATPTTFSKQISDYIDTAIDREAKPILITPPSQCQFDDEIGHVGFPAYRAVMLKLAATRHVSCIDLGKLSAEALTTLGPQAAPAMYLQFAPAQYPGFPEGIHDKTHFNIFGANVLAHLVATEFSKLQSTYQLRVLPNFAITLAAPTGLTAHIETEHVRLRWETVNGASVYRVTRINGTEKNTFTALTPMLLDTKPGQDPVYQVVAYALDKQPSPTTVIAVAMTAQADQETGIAGINVYEIDTQTFPDQTGFSLRFTAHEHVKTYQVYCFNQRTRERKLLGKIDAANVYALHSYQVPQNGTWLVQIVGVNTNTHQRLLSKSVIIS